MSTQGAWGYYKNGELNIDRNLSDSYPTELGLHVLFLKDIILCGLLKTNFASNQSFLADSLFCSWAYIVNEDDQIVEIYLGGNKNKNALGRYAGLKVKRSKYRDNSYYGVALVAAVHFDDMYGKTHDKLKKVCEYLQETSYKDLSMRGFTRRNEKIEKILTKGK